MKKQGIILAAAMATLLTACGSTEEESVSDIPQWVLNPSIEDGIAATDCVKFSGNMSVDQKMARANGRLALAQQIDIRVEGLDKTYSRRTDTNEETSVGTTFSSVSKQVTQQQLTGSRAKRTDIIKIAGVDHLCSLVVLSPSETKELFDEILKSSKRSINAQDEKFLYEEFKAHKAEQDLDKEIARLTN